MRVTVHVVEGLATTTLVFPLVRPAARRRLIRGWSRRLLRMLAVEARVHGELPAAGGNLLVVSNHVSWLDIFVLHSVQPVRFIAKSDLARWPLAGRLIRGSGTLFVERERRRDTHRVNRQAADALAAGDVVAVFPEGTTTDGTTMLPFKSSLLQPIVDAGGHVLPVAIRYLAARRRALDGAGLRRRQVASPTRFARSSASAGWSSSCTSRRRWPAVGDAPPRARARGRGRGARRAGSARRRPRRLIAAARAPSARVPRFRLHRRAASDLEQPAVVEPDRGQRAAPQAARIEHQHVRREHQLERRPVAADDRRAAARAARMREPRPESVAARTPARASR